MTKEEVKDFRQKLGLSQSRFAALMNVTAQTVSCWERGIYKPPAMLETVRGLILKESKNV